jgi:hypothetical protein
MRSLSFALLLACGALLAGEGTAGFGQDKAPKPDTTQQPETPKPEQQDKGESSKLLTTKATLLFPHPTDKLILETINVTDNGKIAFVVKMKDGKERVLVNGKAHKPYPNIVPIELMAAAQGLAPQQQAEIRASRGALARLIKFTPNTEKVYYTVYNGRGYLVAGEGYESKLYDSIMEGMPVLSPDSKKVAFAAGKSGKWFIVTNDKESKDFDDILVGTLVFSPDSQRLAFCARKATAWSVHVGDAAFPAHEGIAEGSPIFSPDSKKVAYIAFGRQNRNIVMMDGKAIGEYDAIGEGTLTFSPDSAHIALAGKLRNLWYIQVDGKAFGPYEAVGEGSPVYSKDSKRVVWTAKVNNMWYVFENGKELAYPPKAPKKKPEPIAAEQILKGTPALSPDGKRLAFGFKRRGKWVLWCEGTESAEFDGIREASFRFSWDSSKFGFVGIRGGRFVPVIDMKEHPPALDISPTRVSGNDTSSTIAWAVKRQRTPAEVAEVRKKDPEATDTYWMIMDTGEERFGPYNNIQAGALSVSWNGQRFAIPAQIKQQWGIFINGEQRTDGLPIWIRFHPETHMMEMIAVTKEGYLFVKEVYE